MTKTSKAKLKLFKTVIGFHDAYVAASSQKAALQAWGASTDLFSASLAERVDKVEACPAAFEQPGTVVTMKRGTKAQWTARAKPRPKKPSKADTARAGLEAKLARLEQAHARTMEALKRETEALEKRRRAAESEFAVKRGKLREKLDALRDP